jgi:tetratricopeptide (TPR) repeat protein
VLVLLKRRDKAIGHYEHAVRLKPDYPECLNGLGTSLAARERWDEAIAALGKAVHYKPDYAEAHYNLGHVLKDRGRWQEAAGAYEKATHFKPDFATAYAGLGQALVHLGKLREALTAFQTSHDLGKRNPRQVHSSAKTVQACRRLVELDEKLPEVLRGTAQPADAGERLVYASLCSGPRRMYAAAARLYLEAFHTEEVLADASRRGKLSGAARAAAQAGTGQGADAADLRPEERARWRQQALAWLRMDLARLQQVLAAGSPSSREAAVKTLQEWLRAPAFAAVRDYAALGRLPEAERLAWAAFWTEVGQATATPPR